MGGVAFVCTYLLHNCQTKECSTTGPNVTPLPFTSTSTLPLTSLTLDVQVATEDFRLCLLSAAAALGVVCTFGTPVGGVLFSIELTAVCPRAKIEGGGGDGWRGRVRARGLG